MRTKIEGIGIYSPDVPERFAHPARCLIRVAIRCSAIIGVGPWPDMAEEHLIPNLPCETFMLAMDTVLVQDVSAGRGRSVHRLRVDSA